MKFIKSISLITCLLILLTGCVKGDVNIAFKDSTNANIEIKLFFPESLLNEYNTSIDELTDKLKENGLQDWTSEKSRESINGVTYLVLDLKAPESINKGLISFLEYHEKEKSGYFDYRRIDTYHDCLWQFQRNCRIRINSGKQTSHPVYH